MLGLVLAWPCSLFDCTYQRGHTLAIEVLDDAKGCDNKENSEALTVDEINSALA